MIPRKNALAYFSIALLRKIKMLHLDENEAWKETRDFYKRSLTVEKRGRVFLEARGYDIPRNIDNGLAALGICYSSEFYEYTQREARVGLRTGNLEVLLELPFCYQVISAVASAKPKSDGPLRVLVPPYNHFTAKLVLGDLAKSTKLIGSCSIPQELAYLGTATFGVDRIVLKKEFEGDIGNDGRPYEHFESLDVLPIKSALIDGEEHSFSQIVDKPVVIGNTKCLGQEEIKQVIAEIEWLVHTKSEYEWRKVRVQSGNGKSQDRVQSHSMELLSKVLRTERILVVEGSKYRAINPKNEFAVLNMTGKPWAQLKAELGVEWYLSPYVESLASPPKRSLISKKLKKLSAKGYEYAVFVGLKEVESHSLRLKNLKTREQKETEVSNASKAMKDAVFDSAIQEKQLTILIQEPGYPGYERRLFLPGSEFIQSKFGLVVEGTPIPKEEKNSKITVIKLNYKDMARLVSEGYADMSIIGYDQLLDYFGRENKLNELIDIDKFNEFAQENDLCLRIENLNRSKCSIVIAVPRTKACLSEKEILSQIIVTEYTGLAKLISNRLGELNVQKIHGCSEVYPNIVLDVVSSGETLKRNEKEIYLEVLKSSAVVLERTNCNCGERTPKDQ